MNNMEPSGEPTKKKRTWLWAGAIGCLLLLLVGAAAAALYIPEKPKKQEATRTEKKEELMVAHDRTTVLIMGIDERTEDVGRTDTLMLAMLDPATDRAALLSIPRDTRVRIQGHGFDKINAAYAYGKVPLAESTVENFLGVEVNHYLIIDTKAFVKVIDAIGGVDINVEERMYYEDPWDDDGGLLIDFQPGLQHMDGRKAITYVRYRDLEGDAGRIRRQQAFMKACMERLVSPAVLASLPTIVQEISSSVRTDLSLTQLLALAGSLKKASEYGLNVDTVPGEYEYLGGICYLLPNVQKMRKTVANTLGIQVTDTMLENFERTAQDYEESLPPPSDRTPVAREYVEDEYVPANRRSAAVEEETPAVRPTAQEKRSSDDKAAETRPEERKSGRDAGDSAGRAETPQKESRTDSPPKPDAGQKEQGAPPAGVEPPKREDTGKR